MACSPTVPNPPKGQGTVDEKGRNAFAGVLDPKSDPRYAIIIAVTAAGHLLSGHFLPMTSH